uniref:TBC1 domain family member 1-like n=1 Tax=Oncorhynchus gorbuscha TaxID=8017 RepID=UPI001EAEC3A0|nr:TBC1 domain family member 1-like [Oncorhynchus gorbuscha]
MGDPGLRGWGPENEGLRGWGPENEGLRGWGPGNGEPWTQGLGVQRMGNPGLRGWGPGNGEPWTQGLGAREWGTLDSGAGDQGMGNPGLRGWGPENGEPWTQGLGTREWDRGSLDSRGVSVCGVGDGSLGVVPEERKKRGRAELRQLWRKAILQQTLLLRMERENNKIQASESKRQRLDYEEITPCLKDVTLVWESMLGTQARSKVKFNTDTVHSAVEQGVPRQYRGEVWKFLSEQFVLRQPVPVNRPVNRPYKELLKQLTSQQHAILIDLGRTFPTHPYFQAQLGSGQLSLYNLLKAYSLLDPEVGYCQGLSFVAGVLLLHMGEEEAFNMLQFLMYHMGLRKQYRPDMMILQVPHQAVQT